MRYVIKNCDCYSFGDTCLSNNADRLYCKDITDCLLKRIVNECKKEKIINCNIDGKKQVLRAYYHTHMSGKILELLEIEEVDE